jgi:hypothetical protein
VVFFAEGELRPDELTLADVERYRTLVLAGCHHLTEWQAALLREYLEAGGRVAAIGPLGENLDEAPRAALLDHSGTTVLERVDAGDLAGGPQLAVDSSVADFAACLHRVEAGVALHLIRYDYDASADAVPALPLLELELRLPETLRRATAFSPSGEVEVSVSAAEGRHRIVLTDVPLYSIVLLQD